MEQAPWVLEDEREFRRDVLLNAPERATHLAPWPAADWLAAMSIRELAPPAREPYTGPLRRASDRVMQQPLAASF
jgi:hypothetical protein